MRIAVFAMGMLCYTLVMAGCPAPTQEVTFEESEREAAAPNTSMPQQQRRDAGEEGQAAAFVRQQRPFQETYLRQLQLPEGFRVNVFARGLQHPRMMAVIGDGTVYVTQPDAGRVTLLRDTDGDGVADVQRPVVTGLAGVHGIAIRNNRLYLATPRRVYRAPLEPDGNVGRRTVIVDNLPPGGQHPHRTLGFGPDGMLYIFVGSSCNACIEDRPEYAAILQTAPDGSGRRIYAEGLRNTLGFDWHPTTGQMWGMDQGVDWLGGDIPGEELNRIEEGVHYGWPRCWENQQPDLRVPLPEGMTREAYCQQTRGPVLLYQAHSSPIGFLFYRGDQFPVAYRGDAFQAFRGSWNHRPPVGYKLVRVRFNAAGQPVAFEDFMTGFLLDGGQAHFGRIAGLAMARDGVLLLAEDANGVIYRISYQEAQ